jgi:hypothetical protein
MKESEIISALCEVSNLAELDDAEMLDALRALESTYRNNLASTPATDHRRHLCRAELEIAFNLARRVVQLRLCSHGSDDHTFSGDRAFESTGGESTIPSITIERTSRIVRSRLSGQGIVDAASHNRIR